jgi:hypothetical protein
MLTVFDDSRDTLMLFMNVIQDTHFIALRLLEFFLTHVHFTNLLRICVHNSCHMTVYT